MTFWSRVFAVKTQKIAHFSGLKKMKPLPFTVPVLTKARTRGNPGDVHLVFTSHPVLFRRREPVQTS
jgi:hypothetical protein